MAIFSKQVLTFWSIRLLWCNWRTSDVFWMWFVGEVSFQSTTLRSAVSLCCSYMTLPSSSLMLAVIFVASYDEKSAQTDQLSQFGVCDSFHGSCMIDQDQEPDGDQDWWFAILPSFLHQRDSCGSRRSYFLSRWGLRGSLMWVVVLRCVCILHAPQHGGMLLNCPYYPKIMTNKQIHTIIHIWWGGLGVAVAVTSVSYDHRTGG